jgi:dihydroxyacetone kinase-like predicted kinase
VLVLPNSRNVIMAAEEAARLASTNGRKVLVVPSVSQQAALAALVELDAADEAAANAERIGSGLEEIRTGAVAPAARDDADGRFVRGDAVGFAGDEIVAWGGLGSTLVETIRVLSEGAEIVTVIDGAEAPPGFNIEELLTPVLEEVELEHHSGGTASYAWLIAVQ